MEVLTPVTELNPGLSPAELLDRTEDYLPCCAKPIAVLRMAKTYMVQHATTKGRN